MQERNITAAVKHIYQQEQAENQTLWQEVLDETVNGVSEDILKRVRALTKGATGNNIIPLPTGSVKNSTTNIVIFPSNKVRLASTPRIAAAGQDIGSWLARPIVFAASGIGIDIRKILGSEDKVNVYIYPTGNDSSSIENPLLPFKDKNLHVQLSIDGKELLNAEIYVDESGQNAEGTGHLESINESEVHGNIELDIISEE